MRFIGYEYEEKDIKWKKIYWRKTGEETKYSISNIGLVRNDKTGKILKTSFSKGYERVNLTHNGKTKCYYIHVIVALAFVKNPDPKHKNEVNHKNGNKKCNYDYNLEWVTRSENQQHAFDTGLIINNKKPHKPLSNEQIHQICKYLEENVLTQYKIAKHVGCSRQAVYNILNKKTHTDISHLYNIDNYTIKTENDYLEYGENLAVTKYSNDEIKTVCELIDSGIYSLREIEKLTGIPYQTIRNVYYGVCRTDISKKYNFRKTEKNPLYESKKNQVELACMLLDKGFNTREVSEEIGLPRHIVRSILSGSSWKNVSKNYNFIKNKK